MRTKSFVVIIILLSMMLFGCGNEQDKVVIRYCKSIEAGEFDETVSYLSKYAKQVLDNSGGKPSLAATSDAFKMRKGIKKIKILKREVNGVMATINYVYNFNDGTTAENFIHLIKEDGKWKISM